MSTSAVATRFSASSVPATAQRSVGVLGHQGRSRVAVSRRFKESASSILRSSSLGGRSLVGIPVSPVKKQKAVTAMASAEVEVMVKAAIGHPDKLGDCPFSQRVLLTLEEKHVPYKATFIDTANKPEWFLAVNPEGKVPVLKDGDQWVPDSDVITKIIEDKFPEPSLVTPEAATSVGSKVFGSFVSCLKSKDPSDGTEAALLAELEVLETHLASSGPFIGGSSVSAVDLALTPKLYHLRLALEHYKGWKIPERFTNVLAYIERMESRESFKKTAAPPEFVHAGWAKLFA